MHLSVLLCILSFCVSTIQIEIPFTTEAATEIHRNVLFAQPSLIKLCVPHIPLSRITIENAENKAIDPFLTSITTAKITSTSGRYKLVISYNEDFERFQIECIMNSVSNKATFVQKTSLFFPTNTIDPLFEQYVSSRDKSPLDEAMMHSMKFQNSVHKQRFVESLPIYLERLQSFYQSNMSQLPRKVKEIITGTSDSPNSFIIMQNGLYLVFQFSETIFPRDFVLSDILSSSRLNTKPALKAAFRFSPTFISSFSHDGLHEISRADLELSVPFSTNWMKNGAFAGAIENSHLIPAFATLSEPLLRAGMNDWTSEKVFGSGGSTKFDRFHIKYYSSPIALTASPIIHDLKGFWNYFQDASMTGVDNALSGGGTMDEEVNSSIKLHSKSFGDILKEDEIAALFNFESFTRTHKFDECFKNPENYLTNSICRPQHIFGDILSISSSKNAENSHSFTKYFQNLNDCMSRFPSSLYLQEIHNIYKLLTSEMNSVNQENNEKKKKHIEYPIRVNTDGKTYFVLDVLWGYDDISRIVQSLLSSNELDPSIFADFLDESKLLSLLKSRINPITGTIVSPRTPLPADSSIDAVNSLSNEDRIAYRLWEAIRRRMKNYRTLSSNHFHGRILYKVLELVKEKNIEPSPPEADKTGLNFICRADTARATAANDNFNPHVKLKSHFLNISFLWKFLPALERVVQSQFSNDYNQKIMQIKAHEHFSQAAFTSWVKDKIWYILQTVGPHLLLPKQHVSSIVENIPFMVYKVPNPSLSTAYGLKHVELSNLFNSNGNNFSRETLAQVIQSWEINSQLSQPELPLNHVAVWLSSLSSCRIGNIEVWTELFGSFESGVTLYNHNGIPSAAQEQCIQVQATGNDNNSICHRAQESGTVMSFPGLKMASRSLTNELNNCPKWLKNSFGCEFVEEEQFYMTASSKHSVSALATRRAISILGPQLLSCVVDILKTNAPCKIPES